MSGVAVAAVTFTLQVAVWLPEEAVKVCVPALEKLVLKMPFEVVVAVTLPPEKVTGPAAPVIKKLTLVLTGIVELTGVQVKGAV
jgi:hypothetical protein